MTIARDEILARACELYLSDGLEGFSMRTLAGSMGVTAPALYRHYESKEGLLLDVIGEAYTVYGQYLYQALGGSTPEERFRMAGTAFMDFALEHPRFFEMVYAAPEMLGFEELPEELAARANAVKQFWIDRVRECMDAGLLEERDAMAVGLTMWAHCHGLVSIYLRGLLPVGEEEFRDLYLESCRRVLCGMATPAYGMALRERSAESEEAETSSGSAA